MVLNLQARIQVTTWADSDLGLNQYTCTSMPERVEVPCWFWAHSSLVNMYTSYQTSKIYWKNVYFGNMVVEKDANHGLVNFDFLLACLII